MVIDWRDLKRSEAFSFASVIIQPYQVSDLYSDLFKPAIELRRNPFPLRLKINIARLHKAPDFS